MSAEVGTGRYCLRGGSYQEIVYLVSFTENLHEFQVVTRSKQTKKYLEFWEVRKWFLLTYTRAKDRGFK